MSSRSQLRRRRRKAELYDPLEPHFERRGRKAAHKEVLSDELVSSLSASSREYALHDWNQPGLFVRIRPSGSMSFYYRPHGHSNQKARCLGSFPKLNVADARLRVRQIEGQLQEGGRLADMSFKHSAGLVSVAFKEYLARSKSRSEWKKRVEREFRNSVLPTLGAARLSNLTHEEVERLISDRSTYYGRRNLRSIVSSFLSWCVSTGRIDRNILKGGRTTPRPDCRKRIKFDGPGLKIVWDACEHLPPIWRDAFRLQIASGYRMSEILQFPADVSDHFESENYRFLGSLARALIDEMARPPGGYLFRAPGKTTPMTFQQAMLKKLREFADVGPFTTDDLHRSSIAIAPTRGGLGFQWHDFFPVWARKSHPDDEVLL